jgi:hypothetical protein
MILSHCLSHCLLILLGNPMTRLGIEPRTYGLKVRCSTN